MASKSDPIVQFKLRIRKQLRRRLETEAQRHGCSVNYEATSRLQRSFELESVRKMDDIAADLEIGWLRFSDRFVRLELEESLAQALAKDPQSPEVRAYALAWVKTRDTTQKLEQQYQQKKLEREGKSS